MKTENEDNELIAEFMGYESFENKGRRYWRIISQKWDHLATESKDLHYESNWNDLMPVVEKIRPLVHKIDTDSTAWRRLSGKSIFAKLEDVYKAVVEFIRWYNSQNS